MVLIPAAGTPTQLWELDQVLRWLGVNPNQAIGKTVRLLWEYPLIRETLDGNKVFFLGTRKFDNGHRVVLLDEPTITAISHSFPFPPSIQYQRQSPPAPLPTSTEAYANVVQAEFSRGRLRARILLLRKTNGKRAMLVKKRLAVLTEAAAALSRAPQAPRVIVSLSCGTYEIVSKRQKKRKVLEIGWSKWVVGSSKVESRHCIVADNDGLRNGKYVPNRIDDFAFGTSSHLSLEAARTLLLQDLSPSCALTVVGNSLHFAIAQLELEFHLDAFQAQKFDVGVLYRAARRDQGAASTLSDMLKFYKVKFQKALLHNSGNDSRFILGLFRTMTAAESTT